MTNNEMVFKRSKIKRPYKRYISYRPLLRKDFQNRCAYCLIHEGHNGGEANFCIDHFRPRKGNSGRPDLINVYANLYWSCRECNEAKGDTWPSDEEVKQGSRFIDPCVLEDDHDKHWTVRPDGSLESLTNAGRFTIEKLMLWRPQLKHKRAELYKLQMLANKIEETLLTQLQPERREHLERRLSKIREEIEPPVFDRPRSAERRHRETQLSEDEPT